MSPATTVVLALPEPTGTGETPALPVTAGTGETPALPVLPVVPTATGFRPIAPMAAALA